MNPEIPPEITEAARLIENWMKENGARRWEFLGICSRNHADRGRMLIGYTRHWESCPYPSEHCTCGLTEIRNAL